MNGPEWMRVGMATVGALVLTVILIAFVDSRESRAKPVGVLAMIGITVAVFGSVSALWAVRHLVG